MGVSTMFTVDEVARIAHAPLSSVRDWIYKGKLKATKVGRRRLISEPDLRRFLGQADDDSLPTSGVPANRRRRGL